MPWFLAVALFAGAITVVTPKSAAQAPNEASKEPPPESPVRLFIALDGAPAMGDAKAQVAIVEFADYQCPYCIRHATQVLPSLVSDYVNTGKVRYFFKDLPVEFVHSQAFKEAEAARCAGEQGKYWEMHNRLFLANQPSGVVNELPAYALALNLDLARFQRCLDNGTSAAQIRKDIQDAKQYRVQGTPTFFVGTPDSEGSGIHAVTMLYGAQAYPVFKKTLDQMLLPAPAAQDER